jgi:hypothetical protein
MTESHKLAPEQWMAVRAEIRAVLQAVAREQGTLTYADLVGRLTSAALAPNDPALGRLLGEISRAEAAAGRGMLSAVVVRQGAERPGHGFFRLAAQLGRSTADPDAGWIAELHAVYAAWADLADSV